MSKKQESAVAESEEYSENYDGKNPTPSIRSGRDARSIANQSQAVKSQVSEQRSVASKLNVSVQKSDAEKYQE